MNKLFLYGVVYLLSCSSQIGPFPIPQAQPKPNVEAIVSLASEYQTIHSFGASDCWSAKFIGKWADEAKKNQIADLLFSTDTLTNGQPKGIGLSLWRMNIGAGSYEQGEASNISDEWRREECFQNASGQYDWSKQAGSQWFLAAAQKRGVPYTLGFSISPPVHMTQNGKAFSPGGNSLNIKPDRLNDYASFMADVSEHFGFTYLSPINEPQWDWKAGNNGKASQEGTPAQNSDIIRLTKALSDRLSAKQSKTMVITGETAQLDYLYEKAESGRGSQLTQLFGAGVALSSLPNVAPVMSYHSYFTTCDDANLVTTRQKAFVTAGQIGKPTLWQSEFGILGDICGKYNGYPRNTGIDYGLYVAKVIHNDLTVSNVASWQWWLAINPYNYSDGLVYVNGPDGQFNDPNNARQSGLVVDSKQLWAFGNFSRFVRPSMKRIDIKLDTNVSPIEQAGSYMLSAYKDEAAKKIVIVSINMTETPITLPLSGISVKANQFISYTTDRDRNLTKATVASNTLQLSPKSVITFVGSYN
ncbi:hypothetical protein M0L20_26540 [Spirosoma sp. RP8]|uniref:Endo-beta-1,6-galactanase-like domain-containing protein n=1 Tax=Spirosoma liriopis TaxID=2937440 RepID=A0ABT0HTD8_9BACT|nr:glycoside hydrolase [Spirosoma liriopis]MCK8495452.1 hypothetical protein [Spirosoma liriopis]